MSGKPRDRLAAIAPSGDESERPGDTLSTESWRRLCDTAERYRQGEIGIWEVVTAVSDFVTASGDTAKATHFMATLPRPPGR